MQLINETRYSELIKRHPAGYILFGVGDPPLVVPGSSQLLTDYKLDWKMMKVMKLKPNLIQFRFPYIEYKPRHWVFESCIFTLYRPRVGDAFTFDDVFWFFRGIPHEIRIEVIKNDDSGTVLVVGFRERAKGKAG